jgi:hypothetical protein
MVSATPTRADWERCRPKWAARLWKRLAGPIAGDAGPDRALSRPSLARPCGQSRLHLPSGRASIRPCDG